jgi:hypothetical protein
MPAAGNALHAIATEGLLLIDPRAATADQEATALGDEAQRRLALRVAGSAGC